MRYAAAALYILSFWNPVVIAANNGNDITGQNALILFPTIPVSYKGSDTRPVDSVRSLTKLGFQVELMYWRDFATELTAMKGVEMTYDDSEDRKNVLDAGITEILGPYDDNDTSTTKKLGETKLDKYDAVFYWPWPDPSWLGVLEEMVDAIKKSNGHTQVVAMVEDPGLAVRNLWDDALSRNEPISIEDVQDYLLTKRKVGLLGSDQTSVLSQDQSQPIQTLPTWTHKDGRRAEEIFDGGSLDMAHNILIKEQYLYTISDMVVGISLQTQDFLKKIVPGTPTQLLKFLSPVTPAKEQDLKSFSDREGLIFFGFDNPANNMSLSWFVREVMPHVKEGLILHVAGHVYVPDVCNCDANGSSCKSLNPRVICHGPVDAEVLEEMVRSVRVAVNPVLSTAGVATKTCRALAHGTPVVVSDNDGTFANMSEDEIGASAERCFMNDPEKVLCFARKVSELANSEEKWSAASVAGPPFLEKTYGPAQFHESWVSIVEALRGKPINVVIEGKAIAEGPSLASQNWHIAKTLRDIEKGGRFKVKILGSEVTPPIEGVENAILGFETGYQADIVIRQGWPTPISPSSPSYCGVGCRVATILPWEFGSLPLSWMPILEESTDKLWAPSEYNRQIYDDSGWDPFRSSVISCGVDCDALVETAKNQSGRRGGPKSGKITFLMTGGLLPRKGVDIILEEWDQLFCKIKKTKAELVISSGYEYGYSEDDILRLQNIVDGCQNGSIKWDRNVWQSREDYIYSLANAHFYLAPFRSEGFGISIAEAALLNTPVIANVGSGTAADDYLGPIMDYVFDNGIRAVYPIDSEPQVCQTFPCEQDSLCVFADREDPCEELLQTPTWFEIKRPSVRNALKKAYNNAAKAKATGFDTNAPMKGVEKVCWSEVGKVLDEEIHDTIRGPLHRGHQKSVTFLMAGLIKNPHYMTPKTLDFIVEMNCVHFVKTHIVVTTGRDFLRSEHRKRVEERFSGVQCSTLHVATQPNGLSSNRVQRIKEIREYQKDQIRKIVHFGDPESAVVILADFDIYSFPRTNEILKYAEKMTSSSSFPDVLCSNGELGHDDEASRYYDTFATVLLPDTFVHPIEWRDSPKAAPEEDTNFIMSVDKDGPFSSHDLFSWFQQQGQSKDDSEMLPVTVRSCFGGLALFRASKFLDERCSYKGLPSTDTENKYRNRADHEICEHILWNNCMRTVDKDFDVALQPDMVTRYHMKYVKAGMTKEQQRAAWRKSLEEEALEREQSNADNIEQAEEQAVEENAELIEQSKNAIHDEMSENEYSEDAEDIVLKAILDDERERDLNLRIFATLNVFMCLIMIFCVFAKRWKPHQDKLGMAISNYLGPSSRQKTRTS